MIAIENTRLLNELRQRTDDLTESLEQQTATSRGAQGHLQLARRAGAGVPGHAGERRRASARPSSACCCRYDDRRRSSRPLCTTRRPNSRSSAARTRFRRSGDTRSWPTASSQTKQVVHIADIAAEDADMRDRYPHSATLAAPGRYLGVPMLKDDELIGAIVIYRQEVRPFTDKQIELVQNFAAQAVIAIENTRLLNELRQRTDDLRSRWSSRPRPPRCSRSSRSSPGELEPVFEAMLENATRICEARLAHLFRFDGDKSHMRGALHGRAAGACASCMRHAMPDPARRRRSAWSRRARPSRPVHIVDMQADPELRDRQPFASTAARAHRCSPCRMLQGRRADRRHRHLSPGGAAVHRQADRAGRRTSPPRR